MYVRVEGMVGPFKMAVLLLDQSLLHSHDYPILLVIGLHQLPPLCLPPALAASFPGN